MNQGFGNQPGSLGARLDDLPIGVWHKLLLALCFLGVMIENYSQISLPMSMPVIIGQWQLKPFMIGVLLSATSLGLLVGAFVFGVLTDIIGRKWTLILTTAVFSTFAAISAFATDFGSLYALRVASGVGLGGYVPVGMAIVSEFSPARVRGRYTAIFSIGNGLGYIGAVLASMFLVRSSADGWRYVLGIGGAGLLLLPFFFLAVPESVRWLASRGKFEKAAGIVDRLERRTLGRVTVDMDKAVADAKAAAAAAQGGPGKKGGVKVLFSKDLLKFAVLAAIVWFVANYTFYGFIQWMPSFLTKNMGYELGKGYWFSLIAAVVGTGTPALVVGFLADKIGRRKTMTICMASYAIFGLAFFWVGGWSILLLYWFSSAMSSMTYVYTPELFPPRLRGSGLGFSSSIGRVAGVFAPVLIGLTVNAGGLLGVLAVNACLLAIGMAAMWLLGNDGRKEGKS